MKLEILVPLCVGIGTIAVYAVTVWAIIHAPKAALRVQRQLDEEREAKNRKHYIFKTLMSYRATRINPNFVQALNLIDVEFVADGEKPIRDAWKELADHFEYLGTPPAQNPQEAKARADRTDELLAELLLKMGHTLGYKFLDKVYIKKACYYPMGLSNMEEEQHAVRKAVLRVLSGEAKLPIAVFEQAFKPITAKAEPVTMKALRAEPKENS
jgi:hypothetical protein